MYWKVSCSYFKPSPILPSSTSTTTKSNPERIVINESVSYHQLEDLVKVLSLSWYQLPKIDEFNNDNAMLWGWYHLPSWVWPFPRFDSCSILIANHDNQLLSVVQIMILHLIASSSDYFYPMDLQTDLSFPNRAAPDHNEWFRFFHCWERLPAKDSQGSREIVVYYIKRLNNL